MDDPFNLPITPQNVSEASDNENDDTSSLLSFNFDAPADVAPEGAQFKDHTSTPTRARMPESIRNLGIFLNKKRRAAVQGAMRGGATAWLDQDDSGTYDPKLKRATRDECGTVKKGKRRKIVGGDEDGNLKSRKFYRKVGYSFMVALRLESEEGKEYLRSITPGPVESESSNSDSDSSGSSTDSDPGYGSFPKRRRKKRQPKRLGTSTSRADGLTLDDLTNGHPQRRGYKACFEAGDDECTLIEHSFSYPCEACRDGSVECELIVPPALKKVCQRCKQKRRSCSYRSDGGKGVESCDQCAEEGVKCCAGPLKESSYARRYDKSGGSRVRPAQQQAGVESGEGEEKQAERMFVSCNQCRDLGKRCSLKGRNDWGPCSCCRKINEQCKFVLPPLRQRRLLEAPALSPPLPKKRKGKSSRSKRERSSTPEGRGRKKLGDPYTPTTHSRRLLEEAAQLGWKQGRRALKKGPHHILLKTSFCHPIKFNYVPDPMGLEPCDWCRSPFFGFYGLSDSSGPRIVEGYWLQDGEGFEEVHGGYSEVEDQNGELHDRTRMCVGCTFERVRIFSCPEHHIRRLQIGTEIDPKVHDDEAWTESVDALQAGDEERGALVLNSKWCSVCPELASFTCACPPSYTLSGDLSFSTNSLSGKEEEHDDGCGLLLCEGCKELMDHCLKSGYKRGSESLDAVVGETMRNKWLSPRGVRADAEFLTSEGELMVRIGQGMGMEIEIEMSEEYEEAGQVSEVEEEQGIGWKGKGKEVEMFSPLGIQGRKGREVWGGELNCGGKAKRKGNHFSSSGGLMNSNLEHEHQKEMSFGQKIQVGVAHHKQRTAANHHNNTIGSGGWMNDDLEQKIRFGEKIRNGVKRGKEKAKEEGKIPWFNRERGVWGEVSIIDLIDDD